MGAADGALLLVSLGVCACVFSAHLFNLSGKAVMLEDCHNSNPYHPIREAGDRIDCPMNFFRTSGDIRPQWGSVLSNLVTTPSYNGGLAGPGCWGCECMTQALVLALILWHFVSTRRCCCLQLHPAPIIHAVRQRPS